jgi:hypothetical protein
MLYSAGGRREASVGWGLRYEGLGGGWDSTSDEMYDQQDKTDDEQNPGNLACDRRDPA